MLVGQARGVILLTAEEFSLPVFECQGLSVKKILTGFGRTDKRAMQEAVTRFLNLSDIPKPNDAADALAIAIFHTLRLRGVCGKKKK
jgi:crossover junction endodeoxyribonuclease RuvC